MSGVYIVGYQGEAHVFIESEGKSKYFIICTLSSGTTLEILRSAQNKSRIHSQVEGFYLQFCSLPNKENHAEG